MVIAAQAAASSNGVINGIYVKVNNEQNFRPDEQDVVGTKPGPSSFVGAHTLLAHDALAGIEVTSSPLPAFTPQANAVLQFAEATTLPKPPLRAALIDSYFQNVFHRYPVVDRANLADVECSTLMKQAVCMAGSLMRHSSRTDALELTHSLYEKTKLMLFLNHDPDPVTSLATLCLMICWSPHPTNSLSLDCPWQWTGTGVRLALQMGLHKDATYVNQPEAGRLRRLWWILMNADRLQTACFGRPLGVRYSDCDTRLPSLADFAGVDISSHVFVQYTRVIAVWGEIADIGVRGGSTSVAVVEQLTDSLCTWIADLPEEIRLFDPMGMRRPYRQSVSELHMVYLVTIILLEALSIKRYEQWSTSIPAIVAASAIARLIEEVDCREDLSSMSSTTTFYVMAASIPLIYHYPNSAERRQTRQEELQILCSALERMSPRWGGASVVRKNIEKIRNVVERYAAQQQHEVSEQAATANSAFIWSQRYRPKDLFPFPAALCSNMVLLDTSVDEPLDFGDMLLPLGDEALSWAFGETQPYDDPFRLNVYSEVFTMVDEASDSLNSG
ncbi:uncharacterized protein PV07_05238 [Cladophialophora immunda]|uniref:Xylanolytic transcriptional activator regulatory domain-containing protein n=1 Tax=Cladophialophora immunda TaxID=569365 RepID=A0A0D2CE58_9EURO|nr:uncharacterized protein PV07_05238 [Cladophialophora immunda]KIW29423.1 hypothetical protein PV07_05238 [Cladophialophora immunda]